MCCIAPVGPGAHNVRIARPRPANSGVGLGLASQLLADKDVHVLAGVRSKEKATTLESVLNEVKNKQGTFETILLDVGRDDSIDAAVAHVASKYGR